MPLGSGLVLLAGLAAYASMLRTASAVEVASVLAVGAAVVATVVALTRPTPVVRRGSFPLPLRADTPASNRGSSAFVCLKCDTYAAPPDWEAMLKEFEPSRDLEGRGDEKPHLTPGAAHADPVWPRWPIATASVTAPTVPVSSGDVELAGRWTPMSWPREQAPGLLSSEAAIDPGGPELYSVSGAGRRPPSDLSPLLAPNNGERPAEGARQPPAEPDARSSRVLVDLPSLDQWISTTSAGLIARTVSSEILSTDGQMTAATPRASHCAYCRTEVEDLGQASRCSDCRRPVCTPCEESLLEHGSERFCSPCAVNRLGSELLRTIEEPVSLGGPGAYARSGARRARPRRRSAAKMGGPRARIPPAAPSLVAALSILPDLPQPATAVPGAASPGVSAPDELPTKGIPEPVL